MTLSSILKGDTHMLFRTKNHTQSQYQQELYLDMKESLQRYSGALRRYYDHLKEDVESTSSYAQFRLQEVEVYREQYFKARMLYEAEYGNVVEYQNRMNRFFSWRKENNVGCLFPKPYHQSMILSFLDNMTLTEN